MIINNINAKPIKINNKRSTAQQTKKISTNVQYQIDDKQNSIVLIIEETKPAENVYERVKISSNLSSNECAIVGTELHSLSGALAEPSVTDLNYFAFIPSPGSVAVNYTITAYIYDFKKSFNSYDVVEKIAKQWKSNIDLASAYLQQICSAKSFDASIVFKLGVITENYDKMTQQRNLSFLLTTPPTGNSFRKSMRRAVNAPSLARDKFINNVLNNKIELLGKTYDIDVRTFNLTNKVGNYVEHDMKFDHGLLQP